MENLMYSVVIPTYNSGKWIGKLISQIQNELVTTKKEFEIILINDKSPEQDMWQVLKSEADKYSNVKVINLQYNAGQFNALICGMSFAKGKYVITMDDDFQHMPTELHKLIKKMGEGEFDCVIGNYEQKKHNIIRRLGSRLVNALSTRIYNKPKNITSNSFRIMKRELADTLVSYKGKHPQIGPMIFMVTTNISTVPIEHHERAYGKSGYGMWKLIKETSTVILNSSTFPLEVVSIGGSLVALFSFLIGVIYFIMYIFHQIKVPGFTAQILVTTFFSGVILLSIGTVGKYVGRIVQEMVGYPSFLVREVYGSKSSDKEQ